MEESDRGLPELQIALLRRAADYCEEGRDRCRGCHRTPLIGERVYLDEVGAMYCELCRALEPESILQSRIVHGPEYGHTIRLADHRAA
jgi:hypothetical protein